MFKQLNFVFCQASYVSFLFFSVGLFLFGLWNVLLPSAVGTDSLGGLPGLGFSFKRLLALANLLALHPFPDILGLYMSLTTSEPFTDYTTPHNSTEAIMTYVSRPDLMRPTWDVSYTADPSVGTIASGYFFVAPMRNGPMIVDNSGEPVWLDDSDQPLLKFNFRPQTYKNETYLTFWAGDATALGYGIGNGFMLDSSYEERCEMTATNGSDFHEVCAFCLRLTSPEHYNT